MTVSPVVLGVGETGQARARTASADVSSQTSWTSANPAVATVAGAGIVTALASGTTDILGQYQGSSGSSSLQVISGADIQQLMFPGYGASVERFVGQTFTLIVRLILSGGVIYDLAENRVAWATSDSRVVAVAPDGSISAVSVGVATVTATYLGKSATIGVTVVPEEDRFSNQSSSATGQLIPGGHLSLSDTFVYSLVSAPSARIVYMVTARDTAGRILGSIGSNPSVDVTRTTNQSVTMKDEVTIPVGAGSICSEATMTLSTGQQLHASGGCGQIR